MLVGFINRLYRKIFSTDAELLSTEDGVNYFPSDSVSDRATYFTSDQLRSMDEIIFFFAQLFTFINPSEATFVDTTLQTTDRVNLPEYAEFNTLLQDVYGYYESYHETLNGRPEFSGSWSPFVYRISELHMNPSSLLGSKADYKYSMNWPTAADPGRQIIFGCMSEFETNSFIYFDLLRKVGGLTHLLSSKQTARIMHHSRIKDSGEVDTVVGFFNKYLFMTEHMGAGKEMYIPSTGYLEVDYGVNTDGGIQVCRIRYRLPMIAVAIRENVLQWYDTNAKSVGIIAPSITEESFFSLLKAIAYVCHPTIKSLISNMPGYSSLFSDLNNDPLKIALYLLTSGVRLPTMDLNTGNLLGYSDSFHILCGLGNLQVAKELQGRFGIQDVQQLITMNSFSTPGFTEWWQDRDALIALIESGTIPSGDLGQGPRIFGEADRT